MAKGNEFSQFLRMAHDSDSILKLPLPKTKEDILEFLAMAIPLSHKKGNGLIKFLFSKDDWEDDKEYNRNAKAWSQKCESVLLYVKTAFKDDADTLRTIINYAESLKHNTL
jgi:hypothetical protein